MAASAVYTFISGCDFSSGGGQSTNVIISGSYDSTDLVSTNYLAVDNSAIPVSLQTNLGNIYPLEKGSISRGDGVFLIDTRPYLIYDDSASFTGPWYVYYGAGINDIYTTANIVQTVTINSGETTKSIYFGNGDIAVITTNASTI